MITCISRIKVNNDGVVDLAVGAPLDGVTNDGLVVLMYLTPTGVWGGYSIISGSSLGLEEGSGAQIGIAVAAVRCTSDEGNSRALLAISSLDSPEGSVHLVFVTDSSPSIYDNLHTYRGSHFGFNETNAQFGKSLTDVGDWIGDGQATINDILVGAPGFRSGCLALLSPENSYPLSSRAPVVICGSDIDEMALADGDRFGASVAWVRDRIVVVGAESAFGSGGVWILGLTPGLAVEHSVRIDTSTLGLETGDRFGSAIAIISPDFDGSSDTLDIAVGASFSNLDASDIDAGAVYLLVVIEGTGDIQQSFKLQNFNNVPYYTGGSITSLLGRRDHFGSSICMLELNDDNDDDFIEMTVGIPGYSESIGNNRGGAWMTLFLNHIATPTSQPITNPTISTTPSFFPTSNPTSLPSESYAPTLMPSKEPTSSPSNSLHPSSIPTRTFVEPPTEPPSQATATPTSVPRPRPTRSGTLTPTVHEITMTGSVGFLILAWSAAITVFCVSRQFYSRIQKVSFAPHHSRLTCPFFFSAHSYRW